MARLFLSYAREDARRAQAVAAALEDAGHQVWWDHHIEAGAEYSRRIADALRDSDQIVVLWSKHSVNSPWVRDEAAVGRDSGRLIPVVLGKAEPPLGFRQYQGIAVSSRSGDAAGLKRVVEAVAARSGAPEPRAVRRRSAARRTLLAGALALLLLLLAGGAWLLLGRDGEAPQPTLAVLPFVERSGGSQTHIGEGLAEEIMTLLSSDPHLRIVGASSSWQLRGEPDALQRIGATHMLEGSVRATPQALKITARLIDLKTAEQIWSEEYQRPAADIFAIQEQIGQAVADMLRGTFAAARELRKARATRTSPEVYNLFLAAKAYSRERSYEAAVQAERLLESALAADPDFAPAHAELAMNQAFLAQTRPSGIAMMRPEERRKAQLHAAKAIALAPRLADAHLARAFADPDPAASIAALQRAISLDPGTFRAWNALGLRQARICRHRDSAASFARAAAIEPLLPAPRQNLISALSEIGREAEAAEVLASFQSLRPPAGVWHRVAMEPAFWSGAIVKSLQHARDGLRTQPNDPQFKVYAAYALRLLGRLDEAIASLPSAEQGIVGSYWRGDYDRAGAEALRVGPAVWERPYLAAAGMKALLWSNEPDAVLRIAALRSGSLETFGAGECDLYRYGPLLIEALRRTGRIREASAMLERTRAEQRVRRANGYVQVDAFAHEAALAAATGNDATALAELERAVKGGWMGLAEPSEVGLGDPSFRRLRGNPRFRALQDQIRRRLAAEAAVLGSTGGKASSPAVAIPAARA